MTTDEERLQALENGTPIYPFIRKPLDPLWMAEYTIYGGGVYVSYKYFTGSQFVFDPKISRCRPRLGPHRKRKP